MNRDSLKPALTYQDQISRLLSRGLIINDISYAEKALQCTNYYRLSAYSIGLINENNQFLDGVTIEQLYNLYLFDEELRHFLFAIIEPIEIRLRSEVAYYLGTNFGNVAHLDVNLSNDPKNHLIFMEQYYRSLAKSFSTDFVTHNVKKYGELPVWAAVELITFGTISKYFGNLKKDIQKDISRQFNSDIDKLPSWFESLTEIRNICAHSGRIYNRNFKKNPKLFPGDDSSFSENIRNKLFPRLIIIKKIYRGKGKYISFYSNLSNLIKQYQSVINLNHLGFPEYWRTTLDKVSPETSLREEHEYTEPLLHMTFDD